MIFDSVESALTCAVQIQKNVRERNRPVLKDFDLVPPRIAIDFGLVRRVLRSYGFDFSGSPVLVSDKLSDRVNDGSIVVTKIVEDNLGQNKHQFRLANPSTVPLDELGSVECKVLDWE
jgi:hypothetical protein